MATKAQIQAALNEAMNRIVELEAQLIAKRPQSSPKAILPWDAHLTRRQVMAAAKQEAMATGRAVLAA
jgi:hypothetical protein